MTLKQILSDWYNGNTVQNILYGMSSLSIFPPQRRTYEEITGFKTDTEAIAHDWEEISKDLSYAIKRFEDESIK